MEFLKTEKSAADFSNGLLAIPENSLAEVLFVHSGGELKKKVLLGRNSSLKMFSIYSESAKIKNSFSLAGNSKLEILDIFSGSVTVENKIPLEMPGCTLNLTAKGEINENEAASYSALASIGKKAANANVNLEEHAYLLGKGAKVHLVPGLEISNNDVNARHASSIREMDSEQVFYLMSRGLSENEAKNEIVSGFLFHEKEKIEKLFNYQVEI